MPRTRTESLVLLLILIAATLVVLGRSHHVPYGAVGGTAIIMLCVVLIIVSFTEVPANPPSVAIPTFLGARERTIITEGWVLAFPGIEDLIILDFLPLEETWTFDEVRCLLRSRAEPGDDGPVSGGSVTVTVSLVIVPDIDDPDRVIKYLNNGRKEQVAIILKGVVEEAVRHAGSLMTWEEFTFSKARLSADLIYRTTGTEMPVGITDAEVTLFLAKALTNGVADVHDLGVKIRRLNITEVTPEGVVAENAQRVAEELLRRRQEGIDVDTLTELAKKIQARAGKGANRITFPEALEIARIVRGHASETIVRSSGNPFLDALAVFMKGQHTGPEPSTDEAEPPKD